MHDASRGTVPGGVGLALKQPAATRGAHTAQPDRAWLFARAAGQRRNPTLGVRLGYGTRCAVHVCDFWRIITPQKWWNPGFPSCTPSGYIGQLM